MKRIGFGWLTMISILLVSCTVKDMLSDTNYKTDDKFRIHKFGFTELDNQSHLSKLYPRTGESFDSCLMHSFGRCDFDTVKLLNNELDYDSLNTDSIKSICLQNNIDGLLLTKLSSITLKKVNFRWVLQYTDYTNGNGLEMEMKLFDNNGKLLVRLSLIKGLQGIESYDKYYEFITNVIKTTANNLVDEIQSTRVYHP